MIGASILRHREVIFKLSGRPATRSITFVDADCAAATPQTSSLRDAYYFRGCSPQPPSPGRAAAVTGAGGAWGGGGNGSIPSVHGPGAAVPAARARDGVSPRTSVVGSLVTVMGRFVGG